MAMPEEGNRVERIFRGLRRRPTATDLVSVTPHSDDSSAPATNSLVGSGIYKDGVRIASPATFDEAFRLLDQHTDAFAWVGLYRPSQQEMMQLAAEFKLSPLAVEDTITAHQRPKLERYEDVLFFVLRAANYVDATETVEFGEVHAFIGDRFVITVRHAETPDLTRLRHELEANPARLAQGPAVILLRLLDIIVDDYEPVVVGIENDIDEIETEVFTGSPEVSKRIYQLSREVIDFQRAVRPLKNIIYGLRSDQIFRHAGERRRQVLRDIEDHAISVMERVDVLREALKGTLDLNLALQAQRQNEEVSAMTAASLKQAEDSRKIAGWAGVFFVPSLVTGTYGMNFDHMPELHWAWGYPFALALMVGTGILVYLLFKWRDWI